MLRSEDVLLSEPAAPPAGLVIRPFEDTDADYAGLIAIRETVFPQHPVTVEELRHRDQSRRANPKIKYQRLLGVLDGQIVASGGYDQFADMYHPRKFFLFLTVHRDFQGQGLGRAMADAIEAAVAPYEPIALTVEVREDWERSMRFVAARGFAEEMRVWESNLDVEQFDPAPYAEAEAKVAAQGITIAPLAELLPRDPEAKRKLYELETALSYDIPTTDPVTPMGYEYYDEALFNNPNLLPEAFFVACDGERYVGMSVLWRNQGDSTKLSTGLTGTLREYRRRGLALAMKLRAVAYARAAGVRTVGTFNASTNRPMLSINEAMGFVKEPAWVFLSRRTPEA